MVTTDFSKFVESQQDATTNQWEWDQMRDKWLAELATLHRRVAGYLEEYVVAGSITYDVSQVSLTEENLGTYLAPKMNIKIGRQYVALEPIATSLFFCAGRVDVVGSAGRGMIMLLDKNAKSAADLWKVTISIGEKAYVAPEQQMTEPVWVWKIVTQTAQKQFIDLEKESFFSLLMEVANG